MMDTPMKVQLDSITRSEVYELLWTKPMSEVAPSLGISPEALRKLCLQFQVARPPTDYWTQLRRGIQLEKIPLEAVQDDSLQSIDLSQFRSNPERKIQLKDPELQKLVDLESIPGNRIKVEENKSQFHPMVRETESLLKNSRITREGVHWLRRESEKASIDIRVTKVQQDRALRLMNALINGFLSRGYKLESELKNERRECVFTLFGEKFYFRLRELSKRVRDPKSTTRNFYTSDSIRVLTGKFELELHWLQLGYAQRKWKDGKQRKLESMLNQVMIGLLEAVEEVREWRKIGEEHERAFREKEEMQRKARLEYQKEERMFQGLMQSVEKWSLAKRIREYVAEVRTNYVNRLGSQDASNDLSKWMSWAMNHAQRLEKESFSGESREPKPSPKIDFDTLFC